jgi:hypothetical protein
VALSAGELRLFAITLLATLGANLLTTVVVFAGLAAYRHERNYDPRNALLLLVALCIAAFFFRRGFFIPGKVSQEEWVKVRSSRNLLLIVEVIFWVLSRYIFISLYWLVATLIGLVAADLFGSILGYIYVGIQQ